MEQCARLANTQRQKKVGESQNINHVVGRVSVAAQIFCGPRLISHLSYLKKIVVDEHAVPGSGGVDDDRSDLAIPVK